MRRFGKKATRSVATLILSVLLTSLMGCGSGGNVWVDGLNTPGPFHAQIRIRGDVPDEPEGQYFQLTVQCGDAPPVRLKTMQAGIRSYEKNHDLTGLRLGTYVYKIRLLAIDGPNAGYAEGRLVADDLVEICPNRDWRLDRIYTYPSRLDTP